MNKIFIYYLIITMFTSLLFFIDKEKSKKNKWRIQENTLILFGFLGGCIGALFSMFVFRHKTKHIKFYIFNMLALIIHIFLIYLFYTYKY